MAKWAIYRHDRVGLHFLFIFKIQWVVPHSHAQPLAYNGGSGLPPIWQRCSKSSGVARTSPMLGHSMGTLRLFEILRKVQKHLEGSGACFFSVR